MAKKILVKGDGCKPNPLIMNCPYCGCKFTFEEEDVKHMYKKGDLMGAVVHCPECKTLCCSLYNDMEEHCEDEDEDDNE